MVLGVNTHFEQGWPLAALDRVQESGAVEVRESIIWGKVERAPGRYEFSPKNSGHLDALCARHIPVLLVVTVRNALYDGGGPPVSAQGQAAYGRFVRAVVDRFACVDAVEVGNEINAMSRRFPRTAAEKAQDHVALLRATRAALPGAGRRVTLVGGSSLMVATGFLEKLFAAGLLPLVDAVAIHPYADVPEALPAQIERLRAAMARAGGIKPIWATEFGLYYPTPEAAPPHAWKVMAILSAEGIAHAHWYALLDEPWYPNMGLYKGAAPKPALGMFQRAAHMLANGTDARRVATGDPLTFIYRFGDGQSVMWASGRPIRFGPGAQVRDAQGQPVPAPVWLGPDPVIVSAAARWTLGPVQVLADTLHGAGQAPWRAVLKGADGAADRPLGWVDTNWASHIGIGDMPNVMVSSGLVSLPQKAAGLVETVHSPVDGPLWLSACLLPTRAAPPAIAVFNNGREVARLSGTGALPVLRLDVVAGDAISIRYSGQGGGSGPVSVRRRLRLLAEPDDAALCPPGPSGTR